MGRKDAGELTYLDFSLDVLNRVRGLHLQGDGLASESLHEDLHASAESQDQMESALFLDVVIRKGPSILQLLASEDQSLLVWGDSLLVLEIEILRNVPSEEEEGVVF